MARKGFRSRLGCAGTSSLACSQLGEEPDHRQHQQQWLGGGSRCPSGLSIEHEPCWWRGLCPALEAQLGAGKAHPGEALAGTKCPEQEAEPVPEPEHVPLRHHPSVLYTGPAVKPVEEHMELYLLSPGHGELVAEDVTRGPATLGAVSLARTPSSCLIHPWSHFQLQLPGAGFPPWGASWRSEGAFWDCSLIVVCVWRLKLCVRWLSIAMTTSISW